MTINVELMLACDLKSNTPEQVVETLKYLTRKEDYEFNNPPSHPFFESNVPVPKYQTWRHIFQYDTEPYFGPILGYFPGAWVNEFYHDKWENMAQTKLTVRIDAGSYSEFTANYLPFLDWLAPYVDTDEYGGFIGYIQGENTITGSGRVPILLFCEEGKIYFSEVSQFRSQLNEATLTRLFYGKDI